jgi:hypothetical protein
MSAVASYARVLAYAAGIAQPIATVRHVHLSPRPLVVVPLTLAGEANAPLAALVGTHPDDPTLLVVPQPRDRDLRTDFLTELAAVVLPYIHSYCYDIEHVKGRDRYTNAPQILVPNASGIRFLGLLGRSTRFRRTDSEFPVPPTIPLLGRWLTFAAERAEHPGSAILVAMTDALAMHWATGQSALEDANLAALLGWIDPPDGLTGEEAARLAEDPTVYPPAGPATDPDFDNGTLAPAVRVYSAAEPGSPEQEAARRQVTDALRTQLEPTWGLMWRALRLLRDLPAGASVAERWAADRQRFTGHHEHVTGGGLPQGRRDGAVASAQRLNRLENELAAYEAARAFDDPLVMAGYRATGAAFAGTVLAVDPSRRRPNGKGTLVTRPLVTLVTRDPVHLSPGATVVAASRRNQTATVEGVVPDGTGAIVTLELSSGFGRAKVPPPNALPAPGEELCYSSVIATNIPTPPLPDPDDTPWTHGGPPRQEPAPE